MGQMECGTAYLTGSYACLTCDANFYPRFDSGVCMRCPANASLWLVLVDLLKVGAVIAAVSILCFGMLWALARAIGSTIEGGVTRLVDLVVWLVIAVQCIAQVGTYAQPDLPQPLIDLYAALRLFQQLNINFVSAVCLPGSIPFLTQGAVFIAVLLGCVVLAAIVAWERQLCGKRAEAPQPSLRTNAVLLQRRRGMVSHRLPWTTPRVISTLGFTLALVLTLTYASAAFYAFYITACSTVEMSPASVASLDGADLDLLSDVNAQTGLISVNIMTYDPSFLCYRGSHAIAAALAWTTIVVFLIGFPVAAGWDAAAALTVWRAKARTVVRARRVRLASTHSADTPPAIDAAGDGRAASAGGVVSSASSGVSSPPSSTGGSRAPGVEDDGDIDFNEEDIKEVQSGPDALVNMMWGMPYHASTFMFRHVDFALSFTLSLIETLWSFPTSAAGFAAGGAVRCALIFAAAGIMLWMKPFTAEDSWRMPVRLAAFALAALVALINALAGVATLQSADARPALINAVAGFSYLLVVGIALYALVLFFAVGRSLFVDARAEAALIKLLLMRHAAAAAAKARAEDALHAVESVFHTHSAAARLSADGAAAADAGSATTAGSGAAAAAAAVSAKLPARSQAVPGAPHSAAAGGRWSFFAPIQRFLHGAPAVAPNRTVREREHRVLAERGLELSANARAPAAGAGGVTVVPNPLNLAASPPPRSNLASLPPPVYAKIDSRPEMPRLTVEMDEASDER